MINSHHCRNSQQRPPPAIFSQATKRCLPGMFVGVGRAVRRACVTLVLLALSILNSDFSRAHAQGTAFTYQGRVNANGVPANGFYDFVFVLWNSSSGGSTLSGTDTFTAVGVTNGVFTISMDFGPGIFTGQSCWLEIAMRTNGAAQMSVLSPRQPLTPTPYSVFAESSGGVNNASISAPQLNTSGAPVSGQVLEFNGTNLVWANAASGGSGSGWSLTGNSGTSFGTDFIGTTDNTGLQLRVNNVQGLELYPTGSNTSPNLTVGPFAAATTLGLGINVLGGSPGNENLSYGNYSTIAGGVGNSINSGQESVIAGGQGGSIGSPYSAIGGGYYNTVTGEGGAVPGGFNNLVSGFSSFAAGNGAQATNSGSFVWADNSGGTFASTANNQFSVRATGGVNFVTGGAGLKIDGQAVSTSGGGGSGTSWGLTGNAGTTPGIDFLGTTDAEPLELYVNGAQALLLDTSANMVAGQNTVPGSRSTTIGGGYASTATGAFCGVIAGGLQNSVAGSFPTVGGGQLNSASNNCVVGGGYYNIASGNYATISGGVENAAPGAGAVVGGGGYDGASYAGNKASGGAATVAGGMGNTASSYATVAGGQNNTAGTSFSAVLGGIGNNASGFASTVPGGNYNVADGTYSLAAGNAAQAVNDGAFVWADYSTTAPFASTANNQFSVRAAGGVRFVTGGAGMTIDGVPVGTGGGIGGSSSNAWQLTGNAGANPANGYFLGTTDTNGFELHVNGSRGMRMDYATSPIFLDGIQDGYSYGINVINGYWGNEISSPIVGATIAGGGGLSRVGLNNYDFYPNAVDNDYGTVGGGFDNVAGYGATVPGGYNNVAEGSFSFAAGSGAQALYDNSFVWSDGSESFSDSGTNQFDVLASGGANIYTGSGAPALSVVPFIFNGYYQGYGEVGVNTSTPRQPLDVNGGFLEVQGAGAQAAFGGLGSTAVVIGSFNTNTTAVSLVNLSSFAPMSINCSSITIQGGSDLAEPFQMSGAGSEIPQGSVVVIDEASPGHLKLSDQPYDSRVAGVVSGANGINPGIQMQQKGLLEGGRNVALTGRVYVRADTSGGPIKPGDLLTSSANPGHAMRVTDHAKAQGAILGKAMTGLEDGQGMVLVLVTLQ